MFALVSILIFMNSITEFLLNKMLLTMHVLDHKNIFFHAFSACLRILWLAFCACFYVPLPIFLIVLFFLLLLNIVPYHNRSLLMKNFIMIIYLIYSTLFMLVIACAGMLDLPFNSLMNNSTYRVIILLTALILHNIISFLLLRYRPEFLWKEEVDRVKVMIYTRFLLVCILYLLLDSIVLHLYQNAPVNYLLLACGDILIIILMFMFLNYNHIFLKSEAMRIEYEANEVKMAQQFFQKNALKELSEKDSLTDVYNRREICAIMQKELQEHHQFVCVFIDLDGLKHTNDTYGHSHGDMMLKRFANACSQKIKDKGILARIGGDEFFLVFIDESPEIVDTYIQELQDFLLQPERIEDKIYFSYGISYAEKNVDDYITKADKEMYIRKRKKRGVDVCS